MTDKEDFVDIDSLKTFVASNGKEVHLQPVSMLLSAKMEQDAIEEFREKGKQVDIPTGIAKTAYGEEEYELTGDNLDRPGDEEGTRRNHRLWEAYQRDTKEMNTVVKNRVADYMLYAGVVLEDDEGPGDEWVGLLEWMGVEVPKDPRDLKVLYIKSEVLKTASDLQEAIFRIQAISLGRNLTMDQLRAMESLFRGPLPLARDAVSNPLVGPTD